MVRADYPDIAGDLCVVAYLDSSDTLNIAARFVPWVAIVADQDVLPSCDAALTVNGPICRLIDAYQFLIKPMRKCWW